MTTLRAATHVAVSVALALTGAGCANHEARSTWHAMEPSPTPPATAVTSTGSLPVGPGPTHYAVQQQPAAHSCHYRYSPRANRYQIRAAHLAPSTPKSPKTPSHERCATRATRNRFAHP